MLISMCPRTPVAFVQSYENHFKQNIFCTDFDESNLGLSPSWYSKYIQVSRSVFSMPTDDCRPLLSPTSVTNWLYKLVVIIMQKCNSKIVWLVITCINYNGHLLATACDIYFSRYHFANCKSEIVCLMTVSSNYNGYLLAIAGDIWFDTYQPNCP